MASAFNLTAQLNLRGPSNVNQIVSDIKKQLGTITGDVTLKINAQATKNITQLNSALQTLNSNLSQVGSNANAAANAITSFANSANSINKATSATSANLNKTISATNKLTQAQSAVSKSIMTSSSEMEEFGRQSALAVRRFAAFSTATTVIFGFTNALSKGIGAFIEFDKEFVKVQQVTGKTASQLSGLEKEISRLSTSLGVSSSSLIQVSSTLAQAGLSARDTEKALQALALTDLAPSFESLNDTVEGSIALMRQFNIGAGDLEKALGSINSVAAAFAVESGDLIAAIQRTGGVFANASRGVSEGTTALNEFLAVFTSVRQTTRESAETIATGLRTIFTRIQREDTISALREYGVNLTDLEGKFVGAYKAVDLLSQGLGSIDPRDLRFSRIVEELGGFRQIGKVIPLIQQFGVAQQALGVAQRGQGSLAKDAVSAQISLANQISKVREEFLALMRTIGTSDTFQTLAKSALGFASGLIKVADTVKGILPVLAIIGAGQASKAVAKFGTGFISGLKTSTKNNNDDGSGGGGMFGSPRGPNPSNDYSLKDIALLDDLLKNNTLAINSLGSSLSGLTTALGSITSFSTAIQANTSSLTSNTTSIQALTAAVTNLSLGGGAPGAPFNLGGTVKKFARGGVVPGTGNSDTVPAMLMPGEFVIRKKAVETIGADNLHGMNKYGGGGSIRGGRAGKRKRFGAGGAARIDEIVRVDDFKDGDTFVATVRPKVEEYQEEVRIAEWDAWELENKYNKGFSKVGTVTKFDDIKKLNSDKKILKLFNKTNREQKKIPGNAFVNENNETALQLAEQATGELKKVVGKSLDGMSAEEAGILENRDQTRNARLLIEGINIPDKYKTGRKFNSGGRIQKFMAGGTVDSPKLIQRGTLSYSIEDILKAGLTEEQFLEKIPVPPPLMAINPKPGEYGTQFKIGGVGSGSVPMPKLLKPYLPPDSAAFQSSKDAVFKRSEASAEYRKRKGLASRDYEGKSSTEKSFLAARDRGYNWGGMVQKFMAGGKTESAPFGTGATKFPKRITNAYAKELQKKLDKEKVDNAWYPYPSNERIAIDPEEVSQKFQNEPFDRKRFLSLFNTKISRNELVGNLSDFAKFIGLPGEDLAKVLPQTIDFGGELQRSGNRGTFSRDPFGTQGYDDKGLEAFGFTQVDEQDLFGYQKLMDEKTKEIQKIMKTPTRTFDDGSFSYDSDAFTKAMDEKSSLGKKISDIMGKKAVARKGLMEQKKGVLASTGRGFVSMASNSFERNQPKNVLYHELTHQLLNSLRTQSEDSFTKYKERVSQLFNGDNDDLADAFDALGGSYNSADVVYGRSYKNGLLNNVLQDLRRKTVDAGGRSADPDLSKEAYSMWVESGQQKNAREYRPINPKINDILLKGGQKQETLEKVEDYGKEEFLTTLIQNAPKLDSNMEGILDSTLNELLSNAGIQRQQYAEGGKVQRNIGIIDTDVLRDPANADIVGPAMEKLGITNTSLYSIELGKLAAQARKDESLSRLTAIAGAAGSGKSSLATGKGASDDASLRKTIRSSILTPEDISKVNEVIVLTSTASQEKLDAYLKDVDRAYILSSNERSEQDRVGSNRQSRDNTGEGLYGRKPGTTNSASRDFALEESILRDELGDKAMVLGRKSDSFGLRRKKEGELPEIVQAGGYYTGGFAPPTKGHRGAFDTLLSNMISRNPNASAEDIIVSVAPNLSMDRGEGDTEAEQLAHAARYGIFPADFRTLLAGINFPKGMISASAESTGRGDVLPKMMEVQGIDGRRKFAKLKGALAITSGKKAGALDKYGKAGVDVTDIPRIEDISATKVRQAVIDGDDKALTSFVSPEVASVLMGNRPQLRNRSMMVPTLIEEITKYGATQKAQTNAEIQQLLANAPGGPYGKITKTARENAPDVVAQVEAMREQRDALSSSLLGYRAHNIISLLSAKYPDAYGLDPSRRASVSAQPSDLTKDAISAQLSESMSGEFGGVSTAMPSSGLQEAILKNVEKSTQVKKSSGILPAQGTEILKRFGTERLPNDPSFGPFSGKTVRDTADGGKLKYWNSAFRPETKADKLAYYTATRDYLIDKFNQSQGTKSAQALSDTTSAVLSSQQLGLVGLNPLGYTGLLGPETWNLGTDPSGQERSINASIVQRGLPNQYQNVIDYLSGQTEEIVGGASKLLGISPKKLSKKQRETLGQGNIEGALLEQIFGSAGADILDDALRTRPIDFPMGIGPKAASIFGIDPDIPTEVKRTIDSGSRGKAVEEFQRYFRQQYGIPDPEKAVQKLASGGQVDPLLEKYKNIIASIMPSEYIGKDGFLMTPGGGSYAFDINAENKPNIAQRLFRSISPKNSSVSGVGGALILKNLRDNREKFTDDDYQELYSTVYDLDQKDKKSIELAYGQENTLPHESFHTIQSYLADYYPEIFNKLDTVATGKKKQFSKIYSDSPLSQQSGAYKIKDMFPSEGYVSKSYKSNLAPMMDQYPKLKTIESSILNTYGKDEIIPQLISMVSTYQDQNAKTLLSEIFNEAGLRSDFLGQKFFFGGKVDPLAKKYGLNQSEFLDQQKIAKFMGLDSSQFEEKLSLFSSQKKRLKGKKFSAIDAVADTSVAGQQVIDQQKALEEYLKQNKFASGGSVKLYHGSNSGQDDSVLKSFKDNGILSSMASGYGQGSGFFMWSDKNSALQHAKTLIDPNSNMTTSAKTGGRPMVVEATEVLNPKNWDLDYELQSKNIVDYIYANFDNLKPLLEKSQGVDLGDGLKNFQFRNKIDEYVDPNDNTTMRKVQIGFNDDNKEVRRTLANTTGDLRTGQVVGKLVQALRMGDPDVLDTFESDFFSSLQPGTALKYVGSSPLKPSNIETFAYGGRAGISSKDTVPALLTPGEFVINKESAQNIGYGRLAELNRADKIQGFNKGGFVGVQKFALGGTPTDLSADASSYFRTQAEYFGQTFERYLISVQKQIIDRTLKLQQDVPNAINRFRSRSFELRGAIQAGSAPGASDDQKALSNNAIDELKKMIQDITGSMDSARIDGAMHHFTNNLSNTSISFDTVHDQSVLLNQMFAESTDKGNQLNRVLGDLNEATGVAVQDLEKIASIADVIAADSLVKMRAKADALANSLSTAGVKIALFGGVLSKIFTETTNSRSGNMTSAALNEGTSAVGSAVAFGGQVVGNVSALAASAGAPGMIGSLGSMAATVLPLLINPITLGAAAVGTALLGVGAAMKASANAARAFDKTLASSNMDRSIERINRSFDDFSKDIKNIKILENIDKELSIGIASALENARIDVEVPKVFWFNLIDGLSGTTEAAERSKILEKKGIGAYLDSYSIFGSQEANENRAFNIRQLSPDMAKEQSAYFQPFAESTVQNFDKKLRTGTDINTVLGSLGSASDPTKFAEAIARANPAIEELIIRIKSNTSLTEAQQKEQINSIVYNEAYNKSLLRLTATVRELKFEQLAKETKLFVTSIDRMLSNMERSINKTSFALADLSRDLELSNGSLIGGAKAGSTSLKSINVLQNRNAYSLQEQNTAVGQAGAMFGPASSIVESLLNVSNKIEETVLSTINDVKDQDSLASPEKIAGAIRASMNSALNNLGLPSDLSRKMAEQVQLAFSELSAQGNKDISFDQLVEKVQPLSQAIESARAAQEKSIKALEFWQKNINDYAEAMNLAVDQQIEANDRFRKASSIESRGLIELDKALGKNIPLSRGGDLSRTETARQTGGLTNPQDIQRNILRLEEVRKTQQRLSDNSANSGIGGRDEFAAMQNRLKLTTSALRENYSALKNMAESSDLASAALAKINEQQQKNQAGVSFIEKFVTSDATERDSFNKALSRLEVNMSGGVNQNTSPEERNQTLQAFSMIAPLLGEQQNILKANLLEGLLKESGVGISGFSNDVLNSLKNPVADPATAAAVKIYTDSLDEQKKANTALGKIYDLMATNTQEIANTKLATSIKDSMLSFESQTLRDILKGIDRLVQIAGGPGVPAVKKALGGLIYAAEGQHIDFQSKGTDTVPAMLTPGEFVVNRQATQKNLPLLKSINNNTSYYAKGGIVLGDGDKWVQSGYDSSRLAQDRKKSDKVTADKFVSFRDLNEAKNIKAEEKIYKAPLSYFAINRADGVMLGDGFSRVSTDDPAQNQQERNRKLFDRQNLEASAGISNDYIKYGYSAPPPTLSSKISSIPSNANILSTVHEEYLNPNNTTKQINEKDIEDYINAYSNLISQLSPSLSLNKTLKANETDSIREQNAAAAWFRNNSEIESGPSLKNLFHKSGNSEAGFLFNNPEILKNGGSSKLSGILGLSFKASAPFSPYSVVAGLGRMEAPLARTIEKSSLSFDDQPTLTNLPTRITKSANSYTDYESQLLSLKDAKRTNKFIESKDSLMNKNLAAKLESLYDESIFQATFGSELFKSRPDVKLPLTLYNIGASEWNGLDSLKSRDKDKNKLFSWNNEEFIKLIDDNGKGKIREFPWTSGDFDDPNALIGLRKNIPIKQVLTSQSGIYGNENSGQFHIRYDQIKAKYFNEKLGAFSGAMENYLVATVGAQDKNFKPGSPLGEIIGDDQQLFFQGGIQDLVKFLQDRTPSYDLQTGIETPAMIQPGFEYRFDGKTSGLMKDLKKDGYLSSLLNNNPDYANLENELQKYVINTKDADKSIWPLTLISQKFRASREINKQQAIKDKAAGANAKVTESENMSLKEKLTPKDIAGGLDSGDLETFTEAKRVTLARRFYSLIKNKVSVSGSEPSNISDVGSIAADLNSQLAPLSLKADGRDSIKYSEMDAIRAIFTSLYKPDPGVNISGYFKRLGFDLSNKSFIDPEPLPADPRNPLRSTVDYYKQVRDEQATRDSFALLLARETDYRRGTNSSRLSLTPELAANLNSTGENFTETKISQDGSISQSEDKYKISTYQDIEKIALNPYATPTTANDRQSLLDELYYFYKNDKDSKGRPVWPRERYDSIGNTATLGNVNLFGSNNLRVAPTNLKEWYAIQDNIVNKSKSPDNIKQQLDILQNNKNPNFLSGNILDQARTIAQKWNTYLTGNLYGALPDHEFLVNWLLDAVGNIPKPNQQANVNTLADGGVVYASTGKYIDFKPKGTDTVPAMLTPGEFVVNKQATQKNLPLLKEMNQGGSVIYRASGSKEPEKSKKWWPAMFDFSSSTKPAVASNKTQLVPVDIDGVSFPAASEADINRRVQRISSAAWMLGRAAEEYAEILAEEQKLESSSIKINPPARRRGEGYGKLQEDRANKQYEIDLAKRMNSSLLNYDEETQMIAFATNAFADNTKKPLIKSTPAFDPGEFRDLPLQQAKSSDSNRPVPAKTKVVRPPVHAVALSSDNANTKKIESLQNKDRVWYGGRLWDINKDGKAQELVKGNINSMWDDDSPMINLTDKKLTQSGRLVLDKKYMTKGDLDFLKTWQESHSKKTIPTAPSVRVPENKPSSTQPPQPRSLPTPAPVAPTAPSVRVPENKPSSTKPPQPRSLPTPAPAAPSVRVPENRPSSTTKPPQPRSLPKPEAAAPLTRQEDALGKELIGYGPESFEPIDTDFGNQPKRTWSDYTNKYAVMGRLKSLTKDSSVNLNNDVQKFSVQYSRLSNADMKYIDSEKLRISRMNKDDKEWDELQGKRREAYGDDYVDRNYKFDQKNIREWTDSSGKYNTLARLYSTSKNDVSLITDKDKKITLPLTKLSAKDIDYVDRMIQYKRRDIKMDKFEAEYNASTGAPGWGYDDTGRPTRKEDYKAPDKIGEYQFDPVTGRVIPGSGNFGPRPSRTFRIENGRMIDTTRARDVQRGGSYRVQKPRTPEQKKQWEQENPGQVALNKENTIKRARVALAKNGKRNEVTKTSTYYADKLGFDPSITEADLYDKLRAQQNPMQPPGPPVKPNINSPIVKPPVSAASATVKPPVSAGKYPKTDGTRTDDLLEADQSIFTTSDLMTLANEQNGMYSIAIQVARYRLAESGIDHKTGLPFKAKQQPVTKQNGGLIYAQYGTYVSPNTESTLSLGRLNFEEKPKINLQPNRPGIFGNGRMPSAAGTTPIVSGTTPAISKVKPSTPIPTGKKGYTWQNGVVVGPKTPSGLITTSGGNSRVYSRDNTIIDPRTLQPKVSGPNDTPIPTTQSIMKDLKSSRVWYGGKLWDQNRDGKESQNEQLIGTLDDVAMDGDVRIIRDKDWGYGKVLRLDPRNFAKYSTPEDKSIVKTWLNLGKKKSPAAIEPTKRFANGGLVNYLVDGGSAYDRRKNDPIAQMLNKPSSNTRILDESARSQPKRPTFDLNPTDPLFGTGVMSDDPGESLGKIMKLPGVSHLFDIFDATSSILTGAISVTGGALGKVIAGNNKSEFSDALNKTSDNEIERGKAKLEAAFLHIAKLYDDTTGGTYWTSQLETNAATQEKLYKEKIAFASANGRAWEVTMADDFSAILSNVAAGNYLGKGVAKGVASVNKLSKATDVIPKPGAATSTNILASIVNSPAFTKAGLIADDAGKIKDGIEGLNNLSEQLSENKQSSNQSKSNVYSGPIIKDRAPAVVNYNTGGHVAYASNGQLINFQPKGTDTVPAMLTPGEFVINKASTQKHLPVLQAINSGSYSHGDIVKQFNKGGAVLPNYYMNGNSVSAGTNSNSFDFGSFMRELMGQLSSVLTESIRQAYASNNSQNVSERSNGVSIDKSILDSINTFTNRLKSVADILAGLNSIPSEIRITGQHDVNVIINGDSVLRQLNPDIQQIVMTAMKDGFQKLINNNSPVPADKLINPFNIEGPTQL